MASLTGQTVSSTYDGLLKTDDNDILGAAPKEITDGLGNGSGMTLSTTGDVSIAGDLTVDGAILDSNGVPGASGQILSSTVTGTDWVSLSEISGVDGSGTANYISKWTDGDTIGNSVIYDDGTNVGIGTSSPATTLDVNGDLKTTTLKINTSSSAWANSNADDLIIRGVDSGLTISSTSTGNIYFGDSTSAQKVGAISYLHSTDSMSFDSGGAERMRITGTGNVGIGTTSPAQKLDVNGNIVSNSFYLYDSTSNDRNVMFLDGSDNLLLATGTSSGARSMLFYTENTERMRIDSSGNVGIGTSSPSRKLMVQQTDGLNNIIGVFKTNSPVSGVISFSDVNSTAGDFGVRCGAVGDNFTVFTNGANERMRIDSSGNVGIGTSSPSAKLHLSDSNDIVFRIVRVGVREVQINSNGTILAGSDSLKLKSSSSTINFFTANVERMRLENDGDLHVDGDVIAYSTTISDQRLKDDIQTIDNALDKVSNLRGVSYTWNNGNRKGQKDLGLIAQEVEQVLPELVREKEMPMIDGGTYKTVDYEKIVGVLIEAVKELTEKVNKLEAK